MTVQFPKGVVLAILHIYLQAAEIDFGAFQPKSDIGGNDFNDSPENQLTKFHLLPSEVIFKDTQFEI